MEIPPLIGPQAVKTADEALQSVNELYKPAPQTVKIPIVAPPGFYQADVMYFKNYKRQNHGNVGLLNIIEIASRRGYSYPIKNTGADEIIIALARWLSDVDYQRYSDTPEQTGYPPAASPIRIYTDKGTEFTNSAVQRFLNTNAIDSVVINTEMNKAPTSVVERFNETLWLMIERLISYKLVKGLPQPFNYVDNLPQILYQYNTAPHRVLGGVAPQDVDETNIEMRLAEQADELIRQVEELRRAYPVGSIVRVMRPDRVMNKFKKVGENWSMDLYEVVEYVPLGRFKLRNLSTNRTIIRPKDQIMRSNTSAWNTSEQTSSEEPQQAPRTSRETLKKEEKVRQALKREGIDESNILSEPRRRVPTARYLEWKQSTDRSKKSHS